MVPTPVAETDMRLAIVTGGSKGLGLALCHSLLDRGYRVVEFSRSAPHTFSVRVDLSDPVASHRLISDAVRPFSQESLDELLVLSNAGMLSPIGPVASQPPEAVAANLQVNLTGSVLGLAAILSTFQATPCPKLIGYISSGAASRGYAGWSLYCAAKAGMEHFVRALALEQRQHQWPFRAVNIDPGVIDTDMQAFIRATSPQNFPDVQRFSRRKEEGGLADPKDVAQRVLRIMSSQALRSGDRYDVADFDS